MSVCSFLCVLSAVNVLYQGAISHANPERAAKDCIVRHRELVALVHVLLASLMHQVTKLKKDFELVADTVSKVLLDSPAASRVPHRGPG